MTNLLYKASIVTTPTAYGVGVLNSIKPAIPFGEELIVNGNFSNGTTNWAATNAVISASEYVLTVDDSASAGGDSRATQAFTTRVGFKYKVLFNRVSTTSSFYLGLGAGAGYVSIYYADLGTDLGFYERTFIATSTTTTIALITAGAGISKFSDVSVKEVTNADFDFSRTSSATRVNPDYLIETVSINSANLVQNGNFSELGAETVTNGNFETDSDWNKTQATISNGVANISSDGSYAAIDQSNVSVIGKTYLYSIDVKSITGTMQFRLGSGTDVDITTTGIKTGYIVATSTTLEIKRKSGAGAINATIDNVSVKQVDPNDNWILGTGWSIGTNKAICDGSSTFSDITQSSSIGTNLKYKVTYTILDYVIGSVKVIMNNNSASGLERNANGTYSDIITSLSNDFSFRALGSGFNGSISNVSVIEIQENGVPRLDYTNGTASILLEPQSTNLVTYSEAFDNAYWNKSGASVVGGFASPSADSPLGAFKLVFDGSDNFFYSSVSNTIDTSTIYIKGIKDETIKFGKGSNVSVGSLFTLSGEWQRLEYYNSTTSDYLLTLSTYSGATAREIYIFGAQVEALTYPTSYIPTSGSTVTRAAETLNNAGNSDLINSTEGVLYAEISGFKNDSNYRTISLTDTSGANRINIWIWNDGRLRADLYSASVEQFGVFLTYDMTTSTKIAVKYKVNDFSVWVNGVEVYTDSIGATPIGLSKIDFSNGVLYPFYGKCKTVAVFSEALSDTELACLTSTNNREIFLNYYYRMQYVGANTEALSCAEQTFNI